MTKNIRSIEKDYAKYVVQHVYNSLDDYKENKIDKIRLQVLVYNRLLQNMYTSIDLGCSEDSSIMSIITHTEKELEISTILQRNSTVFSSMTSEGIIKLVNELLKVK